MGQARSTVSVLVVLLAVVGGALLLCGALVAVSAGSGMYTSFVEKDDIQLVLDQLMQRLANKDARAAYALFSTRAQRYTPPSQLEALLRGENFVVVEGYRSLEVGSVSVGHAAHTDPRAPQGTVAKVQCRVSYASGHTGVLQAVLEKESGYWRVHWFNVVVPPEKMRSSASTP